MPRVVKSKFCKERRDLPALYQQHNLVHLGAEIGVRQGNHAKQILDRWPGKLFLVDPWRDMEDCVQVFDPKHFRECQRRLAPYDDRIVYKQMTSAEAADEFYDNDFFLDWVYIDANHSFQHVQNDLSYWWDNLQPDGILAGHDVFNIGAPDVTIALFDFVSTMDRTLYLVPGDVNEAGAMFVSHSWYVYKNGIEE